MVLVYFDDSGRYSYQFVFIPIDTGSVGLLIFKKFEKNHRLDGARTLSIMVDFNYQNLNW